MRLKFLFIAAAAAAVAAPAYAGDDMTTEKAVSAAPAVGAPPAGMGQVVFYRPSSMGALISCRVSEGDKVVNKLPPGKYFVQTTAPGIHEYAVHSEAKDTLRVNVEEGETTYARCAIGMGFFAGRPNLSTQDRADFDKRGKHLKLQPPFQAKEDAAADQPKG